MFFCEVFIYSELILIQFNVMRLLVENTLKVVNSVDSKDFTVDI
jgi:hypothetical protein